MADGGRVQKTIRLGALEADAPNVQAISFFSGCGGLDLGFLGGFDVRRRRYAKHPVDIVAAYDVDARSVQTYRQNIGTHVVAKDLATAKPQLLPVADLVLGGFPCQEFSACGPRKGIDSDRGSLFRVMVDYAKHHRPIAILCENVAGLLTLNKGRDLQTIRDAFQSAGYRCATWEMHAEEYGVPQARHRVFLVFVREDIPNDPVRPLAPKPTPENTVRGAIADLLKPGRSVIPNQGQYFKAAKAGRGHGQGDERSPADAPGYTVRANAKSRVQFHYSRPRRLTIRECARLQTFPDTFIFPHDATTNMFQIGNAVPPVLGHAVASVIVPFVIESRSGLERDKSL